jgi:hypothetical protein
MEYATGQYRIEFVWEKNDIMGQKSGRGCELISLRSRIIDMKSRRVVQPSNPRREPARKTKDKRGSVDRRSMVCEKSLGRTGKDRDFEEVNS